MLFILLMLASKETKREKKKCLNPNGETEMQQPLVFMLRRRAISYIQHQEDGVDGAFSSFFCPLFLLQNIDPAINGAL